MSNLPIVVTEKNHILTTSLLVAEKFGKNHRDVLKAIRNLDVFTQFNDLNSESINQFTERNFALSKYTDPSGRALPMYSLTRDGFSMLAMGFTGKKAVLWKIAFINAFNRMEQALIAPILHQSKSMESALFAKHPQWQETRDLYVYGFSTREMALLQGKTQRNVQRMIARIKKAGIHCHLANRLQAA